MDDEKFDTVRAMKVLSHPARMRIVELLATRGPMSWKELSQELQTGTGALYNHLDTLEYMISRDSSKRYELTKLGREIYSYLNKDAPERNPGGLTKIIRRRTASGIIMDFFIPRSALNYMTSTRTRSAIAGVTISLVALSLIALSKNEFMLLSYSPANSQPQVALGFFGSLFALTVIAYITLKAFGEKPDLMVLSVSASLSLLPLADLSIVLRALDTGGWVRAVDNRNLLTIVLALFQGWGAGILAAGMSVSSNLRIEKSLAASLVLLYATTTIIFLRGSHF